MKKRLALVYLTLLFVLFSTTAYAAPKVLLDGKELSFDVPPIIEDGRTLVPLRAIFSALGAEVKWDSYTRTVTAVKDNTNIKLIIDGKAYINFQPVELDVPAKIVDGRTMVPLRFVTESLDCSVEWNKDTQTILLTSKLENKNMLEDKPGYKVFETDDFCIRYSEKWEYSKMSFETTASNTTVHYFIPPTEDKLTDKRYMIAVNIDELQEPLSLEQYRDLSILSLKKLCSNLNIVEKNNTTLNGLPAKNISITGNIGSIPYKQTLIFTVIAKKAYGVSLLEYNNVIIPSLKDFEEAKNSFVIK